MGKLLDSVQNYFKNGSKEQFLKDWEELKHFNEVGPDILEVMNRYMPTQPLFTLTAEEVEIIKLMAYLSLNYLDIRVQYHLNTEEQCKEDADRINNLLNRIKQWQDENKI